MTEENVTVIQIKQTALELVQGDITRQETDAIVNAANSSLAGGGGVDGAIHRAAGPELVVKASRAKAPCPPGEAVLTPGFKLPAKWVIHTVGPRYRDGRHGEAETLARAYRHSLQLAIEHRLTSIAFPSISTGAYGYPIEAAARVALATTLTVLEAQEQLRLVRFVLFSRPDYEVYKAVLNDLERQRHNKPSNL